MTDVSESFFRELTGKVKSWGESLGFQEIGITDTDLSEHETRLQTWLQEGREGSMEYMSRYGIRRSRPDELIPGTTRVVTARMNYLPAATDTDKVLDHEELAYVSRYALGRDYHKVMRARLVKLWNMIREHLAQEGYDGFNGRVFTDSAPVLEKAIAEKAGLGWIGKNTLLLNRDAGSWFFLGEIYTDVPLIVNDTPGTNYCGTCSACIDVCPTKAIVAPYELDARRCISYLTIENRGEIPIEYRKAMGNRIFGCDDCQLICPWNKFARLSTEGDFSPRHQLDQQRLVALFNWTEEEFLTRTEGSAIRRAGYEGWLRNIAVALGNSARSIEAINALEAKRLTASEMLREHIDWALAQLRAR